MVFDLRLVALDDEAFEATAASSWLLDLRERPDVYLGADGFEADFFEPLPLLLTERVLVMEIRG